MRLKRNILETLRRELFVAPNPQCYKKEFFALRDEIFPDRSLFLDFLDEENYEKQLKLSCEILLRLSYDSCFAPPTRLLFNLMNVEMQNPPSNKNNSYFGRDHVVHLVHLYIFGIYAFFNHKIFSENIVSKFRSHRKQNNLNIRPLAIVRDFSVAWRTFALCHDLGYPIEMYAKKLSSNKDIVHEQINYLSSFQQIAKYIGKDFSMKAISKIMAVYRMLHDHNNYTFEELDMDGWKEAFKKADEKFPEELAKYSSYVQIDKIYGVETVRTIASIFGKTHLFAVLTDKDNNQFLAYLPEEKKVIASPSCPNTRLMNEFLNNINAPYESKSFSYQHLSWQYYINHNVANMEEIINQIFYMPDIAERKRRYLVNVSTYHIFKDIVAQVYDKTSSNYAMITSDTSFKQYCFDVYLCLYNNIGYNKLNREDMRDSYIYQLDEAIENMKMDIPNEISKIVHDIFKKQIDEKEKNKKNDSDEKSWDDIFKECIEKLTDSTDEIFNKIKKSLNDSLEKQCRFKAYFETLRYYIGEHMKQGNINCRTCFKQTGIDAKTDVNYAELQYGILDDCPANTLVTNLCQKFERNNLNLFSDISQYHPIHALYDHGVCGGIIALSIADVYRQLHDYQKDEKHPFLQIMDIALGQDYETNKEYIDYMFENTLIESFYAIIIHNIYPQKFNGHNDYRTKLGNEPFAYFATLMDCLQFWDRKIIINQAENELPYATYSKSLNIEVKDNKIRIMESDRRMDIIQAVINRKQILDSFLENASNYIELNLADY